MQTNRKKYDSRLLGAIAGLILPIIFIFLSYLYQNKTTLDLFWNQLLSVNIISRVVSLCVIPNLLLFFIFMWKNKLKSAYGVIGATFIYAFIVLILTTFV